MFWFNTGQNEASTYHENQNGNASNQFEVGDHFCYSHELKV